ncbi:MAG: aldolase/citrate lyase family protein [Bacteroidetes bacterium]|nr:aldolase/citrate lyase family protein [Bacteroidota bacterium]
MSGIRPYYFCRLRTDGFIPFYEKIARLGGVLCFDLEDSIDGPDEKASGNLKARQRAMLVDLLRSLESRIGKPMIGVRINSPSSEFYSHDLSAIHSLKRLHSIFLPKLEEAAELESFASELRIDADEIIPVVETTKALDNIDRILSINDPRFKSVAFGHCDFNLSCGFFPFHHQDSDKYWEWMDILDKHVSSSEKVLINSPVLRLGDSTLFKSTLSALGRYRSVTGQITLCLEQTESCASYDDGPVKRISCSKPPSDPIEQARHIVSLFESNRVDGRSFAIDERREIISPQEYSAAMSFLEREGRR